jgi:hypothetical protein
MLDYWKLWIFDENQKEKILQNGDIKKSFEISDDGIFIGVKGQYKNWKLQKIRYTEQLEISGSIHKYWNNGTNENDFFFFEVVLAINSFCKDFDLDPKLAKIINLEFGVNLQLEINASELISQILAFKYHEPIRPYLNNPERYFIEFELQEYYVKIYDKGKQYLKLLPDTPNTLRLEVKSMKSRFLKCAGIMTLDDLQQLGKLKLLANKFTTLLKGLIITDDTIDIKLLSHNDLKLYKQFDSKTFWRNLKGNADSTLRKQVSRYKKLSEVKGKRKVYSSLYKAIDAKLLLLENFKFPVFTPNTIL